MKPKLAILSNPSPPLQQSRILQAARLIADALGAKAISVTHLSEKLAGERPLTWRDIDAIASAIPSRYPHLQELFVSALFGWECITLSRLGAGCSDFVPPGSLAPLSLRKRAA